MERITINPGTPEPKIQEIFDIKIKSLQTDEAHRLALIENYLIDNPPQGLDFDESLNRLVSEGGPNNILTDYAVVSHLHTHKLRKEYLENLYTQYFDSWNFIEYMMLQLAFGVTNTDEPIEAVLYISREPEGLSSKKSSLTQKLYKFFKKG